MSAQHRITFPPEIHGIIVDILATEKDVATIKALARTHSSMLYPCRFVIFATLDLIPRLVCRSRVPIITDPFLSKKLEHVARLFQDNPHLAFYVGRLAYWIPSHMAYDNKDIKAILDSLWRIQTFYLSSQLNGSIRDDLIDQKYWPLLPLTLRVALEKILHSPSLVELAITCTSKFPINVLAGCKNLSHLDIDQVHFQDAASSDNEGQELHGPAFRRRGLIPRIQNLTSSKLVCAGIIDLTHLTALDVFGREEKKCSSCNWYSSGCFKMPGVPELRLIG